MVKNKFSIVENKKVMKVKKKAWTSYVNISAIFSILIMLFCYFSVSIELWVSSLSEKIIAYRPSAFIYALEPILFGGVIYLIPFCACLPITDKNIEVLFHSKSILYKVLYTFVVGGLVVSMPFLLHTILWNVLAIPINPKLYPSHSLQMFGILNDICNHSYGVLVYCIFFTGMFYSAGTYAVIHLLLRSITKNHLIAFALPSIFYFLWLKLSVTFESPYFPSPVDLFNEGMTTRNIPVSIAIYTAALIISSILYYIHESRRER